MSGAGRGGGLLFVALVLFLAYLAWAALDGVAALAGSVTLLAVAAGLLANVARRR